ncbi:YciI family protein [Nocardia jejuensis]|uniref:YciI family protein n=1 Tax=Nocardia jejuensis TaxID=328049 RepID=UPI000830CD86|nr:YciI family protein [Nocardia jejuensis]
MATFAVIYKYESALASARAAARAEHNSWLATLVDDGRALCTGPFTDGSGGLLIFAMASSEDLAALLSEDPFVREELVTSIGITEWKPVHGAIGLGA